jgi:hypothetical protein
MLPPCRKRRRLNVDRPKRCAPFGVFAEAAVEVERLLRP